jgi:hypothetical protein
MLKEWGGIIWDVIRIAQRDLPLTWELLKVGFEMVVSQLADLWPPLWKFVQESASPVWDLIAFEFKIAFFDAISEVVSRSWKLLDEYTNIFSIMKKLYNNVFTRDAATSSKELSDIEKLTQEAQGKWTFNLGPGQRQLLRDTLKKKIEDAGKGFNFLESDRTKELRKHVNILRDIVNEIMSSSPDVFPKSKQQDMENLFKSLEKMGEDVGTTMGNSIDKAGKKLDAVLFRSAEAVARIQEFQDILQYGQPVNAGKVRGIMGQGMRGPAGSLPLFQPDLMPAPGANDVKNGQTDILKDIRDILKKQAGNKVEIGGADF